MDKEWQVASELVARLTLEEQATLVSGDGWWDTHAIPRVGIPSMKMSDGPHGLRRAKPGHSASTGDSLPATCFPTASALAATWNKDLVKEVGAAIGREAQAAGVQVVLGPGVNIKRSPLGGRNFEYFSEDPCLTASLGCAWVQGLQAQGVGASVKHYAANSQESERMVSNSVVDERTLHEIYLPAFEAVVRLTQPWTVMSAYNRVNGIYASEHSELLTNVLRKTWGFAGFVMSDWGAIDDRIAALIAGTDLEMPGSGTYHRDHIVAAVKRGELAPQVLATCATRIVSVVMKSHSHRRADQVFSEHDHHALARRVASEAIVLLKNDGGVLPLRRGGSIAVIGSFAQTPRFQGGGSSHVRPYQVCNALDELRRQLGGDSIVWCEGIGSDGHVNAQGMREAVNAASSCDVAVIFAGLPDSYESEAFDRETMSLPETQDALIDAIAKVQKNTVVVLHNGSAVAMPWADAVPAIVEAWLGGQAGGAAVADVLTGSVNPSGKLAETFPVDLQQTPTAGCFPGTDRQAIYSEGLEVGYRHYDARGTTPRFPFGHGLSYTRFEFLELKAAAAFDPKHETSITVHVSVKNAGMMPGQEVVQLYMQAHSPRLQRPPLELRGFAKVRLEPGETAEVKIDLSARDFAHYAPSFSAWRVDAGLFTLHVGRSSRDLPLNAAIQVSGEATRLTRNSFIGDLLRIQGGAPLYERLVRAIGFEAALDESEPEGASTLEILAWRKRQAALRSTADELPIAKVPAFTSGALSGEDIDQLLAEANFLIGR